MNKSTAIKTEAPQVVDLLRYFLGSVKHGLRRDALGTGSVEWFFCHANQFVPRELLSHTFVGGKSFFKTLVSLPHRLFVRGVTKGAIA